MIRGTIDYSELLFDIGINITGWVEVSIILFNYLTNHGKNSTSTSEVGTCRNADGTFKHKNDGTIENLDSCVNENINTITTGIKNIVTFLSPFKNINTFQSSIDMEVLKSKNSNIKDGLKLTKEIIHNTTDQDSLKSMMDTISINFIHCENTDNLNDFYCKLEFKSSIKEAVNDIEKKITSVRDNMYLSLYRFFIDISKPYGWSYEENKQDIEDKINSRKT